MAISAMEYGNTSHLPQGETPAAINRSAGLSSQERLSAPKPPANPCYYELEQIIELRNAWVLGEVSLATEDSVETSPNLKPRGQEEVLKLADSALGILEKELQAGKSETLMKFLTAMSQFHIFSGQSSSSPNSLTNMNGIVYFEAFANSVTGSELWRSDGTSTGTFMVKDINTEFSYALGGFSSSP